jgi:hypothetical protein
MNLPSDVSAKTGLPTGEAGVGGWLPISTAPRDGTRFIGRTQSGLAFTTWLQDYYEKWPHEPGGPTYRQEWTRDRGDALIPYEPTHWIPDPSTAERKNDP